MKKLSLFLACSGFLALAGCSSSPAVPAQNTPTVQPAETQTVTQSAATTSETGYSVEEVATHSTADSCRSIIRNNVYDFTARASKHPGGAEKIFAICGKDATSVFEQVHGGKPKPEMKLEDFIIGSIR